MPKSKKRTEITHSAGDASATTVPVNSFSTEKQYSRNPDYKRLVNRTCKSAAAHREIENSAKTYSNTETIGANNTFIRDNAMSHVKNARKRGGKYPPRQQAPNERSSVSQPLLETPTPVERPPVTSITIENSNLRVPQPPANALNGQITYASVLKPGLIEVPPSLKSMIFGKFLWKTDLNFHSEHSHSCIFLII